MLTQRLGKLTKLNSSEVIDSEPSVAGIVSGEKALKAFLQNVSLQSFGQLVEPHFSYQVLEEDLDENSR